MCIRDRDTWTFTGEPISVANMEQIKANFYSAILTGATSGALGAAVRGPTMTLMGAIGGAALAGAGWAYSVVMYTPMVTYTPVITITEIPPDTYTGISSTGGC